MTVTTKNWMGGEWVGQEDQELINLIFLPLPPPKKKKKKKKKQPQANKKPQQNNKPQPNTTPQIP